MKTYHNKLVRDNIPKIIRKDGKKCKTSTLDDDKYLECLKAKLIEEANEVCNATDLLDIAREMADVLEVMEAMSKVYGFNKEEVEAIKRAKAFNNGKFEKKIYLEYVIEEDHE